MERHRDSEREEGGREGLGGVGLPQWRRTIALCQWKKERWGEEGCEDNRGGDRSTMTAVFSIRHYLIDRVAGLIV